MEKLLNDYKITFPKGDTYALAVKFKNIKQDLTSAYFSVKENADDTPLIQKTLGAGVSQIDDRAYKNEKTYKIQLQSEDTVCLEPLVQYLYDFRIAVGNVVQTVLSGVFVVQHSISNVNTISNEELDVVVSDQIESDLSTTSPTVGIEYEQDPVALAKIGNMDNLADKIKQDTIVQALNELVTTVETYQEGVDTALNGISSGLNDDHNRIEGILDGSTEVPKATNAENATNAQYATSDSAGNNFLTTYQRKGDMVEIAQRANVAHFLRLTDVLTIPLNDVGGYRVEGVIYIPENTFGSGLYIVGYCPSNSSEGYLTPTSFFAPIYYDGKYTTSDMFIGDKRYNLIIDGKVTVDDNKYVKLKVLQKLPADDNYSELRSGILFFYNIGDVGYD